MFGLIRTQHLLFFFNRRKPASSLPVSHMHPPFLGFRCNPISVQASLCTVVSWTTLLHPQSMFGVYTLQASPRPWTTSGYRVFHALRTSSSTCSVDAVSTSSLSTPSLPLLRSHPQSQSSAVLVSSPAQPPLPCSGSLHTDILLSSFFAAGVLPGPTLTHLPPDPPLFSSSTFLLARLTPVS